LEAALGVFGIAVLLAGCGVSRNYDMPYTATRAIPTAAVAAGGGVAVQRVTIERVTGSVDPFWIGTIRGGFGNPLHEVNTNEPLDVVVRQAFSQALSRRGLLAAGEPRMDLLIRVREFDANRFGRSEATASFAIALRDRVSGRTAWEDEARVYNVEGSVLALDSGILASPDGLHALMLRTMNEAIDQLVDRPGFVATLAGTPPAPAQ
jgi:hypothetical protein